MKNIINKIINTLEKVYFYFKPVTTKELLKAYNEEINERMTTDKDIFVEAMEREFIHPKGSQEYMESHRRTMLHLLNKNKKD
jgi:sensor c-di-GMP phosphodiesterase-like protein